MAKRKQPIVAFPIRDRILVRCLEAGGMTPGGIALPDILDDSTTQGTVLAVGSGHLTVNGESIPLEVEEGDTIDFDKQYATEVEVNGETLYVIKEDFINLVTRK